jgi:hypothetical protein
MQKWRKQECILFRIVSRSIAEISLLFGSNSSAFFRTSIASSHLRYPAKNYESFLLHLWRKKNAPSQGDQCTTLTKISFGPIWFQSYRLLGILYCFDFFAKLQESSSSIAGQTSS